MANLLRTGVGVKRVVKAVPWRERVSIILVAPKPSARSSDQAPQRTDFASFAPSDFGGDASSRDHRSRDQMSHLDPTQRILAEVMSQSTAVEDNNSSFNASKRDFNLLLLKRSPHAPWHLGDYALPGGEFLPEADMKHLWLETYFRFRGYNLFERGSTFSSDIVQDLIDWQTWAAARPPLLERHTTFEPPKISKGSYDAVDLKHRYRQTPVFMPPELGFRICALRHLFTQLGLLCVYDVAARTEYLYTHLSERDEDQIQHRRPPRGGTEVQSKCARDPGEFGIHCTQSVSPVFPYVPAVQEWANWLTPAVLPNAERWDSLVYTCIMSTQPPINLSSPPGEHLEDYMWVDPEEFLSRASQGSVRLDAPLFYELSRIATFSELSTLQQFQSRRERLGCPRFWPQIHRTSDHKLVYLLPGDSDLDTSVNVEQAPVRRIESSKTAGELRTAAVNLHRLEFDGDEESGLRNGRIFMNIAPPGRHVKPI